MSGICGRAGVLLVWGALLWPIVCQVAAGVQLGVGVYRGVNVEIDEELALQPETKKNCQQMLSALEHTLTDASAALYAALDGRYYFGDFNVLLPPTWADTCIPTRAPTFNASEQAASSSDAASTGTPADVTVTGTHTLYGDAMWTLQSGGCGQPGQQIYLPQRQLGAAHAGKTFVREWAKYRYGVFDELGYDADATYAPCYYGGTHTDETPSWHLTGCADHDVDHDNDALEKSCQEGSLPNFDDLISASAHSSLLFAPQGANVTTFCTTATHNRYAPTKHNYMCDRRAALDVIEQHADFAPNSANAIANGTTAGTTTTAATSTRPQFYYRRRTRTRFVVIVEDTLDMAQRESWNFLRSAFRKWILYDLMPQSEVGVVLANGRAAEKQLAPVSLSNATNRDLVASFLPYTPSDAQQPTCMACALVQAQRMLAQQRQQRGGAAEVVVVVAPGIESASGVDVVHAAVQLSAANVRLATVNYPAVLALRRPLDELAAAAFDRRYSVYEQKFNSERSYLTTYVQLANVLMDIGAAYCEGAPQPPVEIHRHEIYDSTNSTSGDGGGATHMLKRNTRQASGYFYLEPGYGAPAGFYIYTHSAETPLIQALRLVAPSGRVYGTRSDLRMSVKQLTLLSALNETGLWRYEIERYPGNPQPHVVQVTATPSSRAESITMRAWVQRERNYLTLYCRLERGRYAVVNALVQVTVHYQHNNTAWQKRFELCDTGAGVPDLARGDGIYTRQLRVRAAGVYQFEFYARGRGRVTYSIRGDTAADGESAQGAHRAGAGALPSNVRAEDELRSSLARQPAYGTDWQQPQRWRYTAETGPFERYAPTVTVYVVGAAFNEADDATRVAPPPAARILDLRARHADEVLAFEWTPFDEWQVDTRWLRYELRYGASISDMVDHVDNLPLLATINADQPAGGAHQRYTHNLTQTPLLYDGVWCFMLRPLLEIGGDKAPPQQLRHSNIAQLYISAQPRPSTERPVATSAAADSDFGSAFGGRDTASSDGNAHANVTAIELSERYQLQRYILPAGIALLLLLVAALCVCCYVRRWRGKSTTATSSVEHSKMQEAAAQPPPLATPEHSFAANNAHSAASHAHSYAAHSYGVMHEPAPDHHTVGIPIYSEDIGGKQRLSVVGSSPHGDGVHTISGHHLTPPYYHQHSVDAQDACDNWSAQQQPLTHAHYEHMQTPLLDEAVPPVPPLPLAMPATLRLEQSYTQLQEHAYPHDYQLYTQQQHAQELYTDSYGLPPPTYSTIARSHTSLHAEMTGGGVLHMQTAESAERTLQTPKSAYKEATMTPTRLIGGDADTLGLPTPTVGYDDKRRRNVTMV